EFAIVVSLSTIALLVMLTRRGNSRLGDLASVLVIGVLAVAASGSRSQLLGLIGCSVIIISSYRGVASKAVLGGIASIVTLVSATSTYFAGRSLNLLAASDSSAVY